jgi:hypothetical protein
MKRIDVAYTLHSQGDLLNAETIYRSMIEDGEDVLSATNNLFALLQSQSRWSDLAGLYRTIEHEIPSHADWAIKLYSNLLSREQYEAGWQWYEARRHGGFNQVVAPGLTSVPEWSGAPVKRLLVWREQGFGDEIQFARYIPELVKRGIDATVLCSPALARLFQGLAAEVVPLTGAINLAGTYDAWCLMGSLPLLLGAPFAIPPPISVNAAPLGGGGVGVMVKGSSNHANDFNRSMPAEAAHRLLALPGAVSLDPQETGARDFQETAEIIAGLDHVMTVDTSIAHLAGSMGKSTFVFLPTVGQDWRWLRHREDSPWYPSVHLVRQPTPGDWQGAIERAASRIGAAK